MILVFFTTFSNNELYSRCHGLFDGALHTFAERLTKIRRRKEREGSGLTEVRIWILRFSSQKRYRCAIL
jgi:hypothetical protein